jgi:hypothetical protein
VRRGARDPRFFTVRDGRISGQVILFLRPGITRDDRAVEWDLLSEA